MAGDYPAKPLEMANPAELYLWLLAGADFWTAIMITGGQFKIPPPPQGSDPIYIWAKLLTTYLQQCVLRSVKGGKIKNDSNFGKHLVIDFPPFPQSSFSGWFFGSQIELPDAPYPAYSAQQVIHIQSTSAIVTDGIVDAANPTGPLVQSTAGLWVALQAVPAQATVDGNAVWNLPQLPMPNPLDWDDEKNYWAFICPDAQCYV